MPAKIARMVPHFSLPRPGRSQNLSASRNGVPQNAKMLTLTACRCSLPIFLDVDFGTGSFAVQCAQCHRGTIAHTFNSGPIRYELLLTCTHKHARAGSRNDLRALASTYLCGVGDVGAMEAWATAMMTGPRTFVRT